MAFGEGVWRSRSGGEREDIREWEGVGIGEENVYIGETERVGMGLF